MRPDSEPDPFLKRLVEHAIERWGADTVNEGLRKVIAFSVLIGGPADWLTRHEEENPLWFVVDPLLDEVEGFADPMILVYLMDQQEGALSGVVEHVLIEDGEVARLAHALQANPADGFGVHHAVHGLRHLGSREFVDAWPPLIIGLEGMVRAYAIAEGLLGADGRVASGHRPGVEGVARKLSLPPYFERFFAMRVYGTPGHSFRHGFATEAIERQVVYLAVATAGWLAFRGDAGPLDALAAAMARSELLAATLAEWAEPTNDFVAGLIARRLDGLDPKLVDMILKTVDGDDR